MSRMLGDRHRLDTKGSGNLDPGQLLQATAAVGLQENTRGEIVASSPPGHSSFENDSFSLTRQKAKDVARRSPTERLP